MPKPDDVPVDLQPDAPESPEPFASSKLRSSLQKRLPSAFLVIGLALLLLAGFLAWWVLGRGKQSYKSSNGTELGVFSTDDMDTKNRCVNVSANAQVCSPNHNLKMQDELKKGMTCALLPTVTLPENLGQVDVYCCGKTPDDVRLAVQKAETDHLTYMWSLQSYRHTDPSMSHCYKAVQCGNRFENCAKVECQQKGKTASGAHIDCGDWAFRMQCT